LRIGIALGLENTAAVIRFGCLPNHTCFVRKPEMRADPPFKGAACIGQAF